MVKVKIIGAGGYGGVGAVEGGTQGEPGSAWGVRFIEPSECPFGLCAQAPEPLAVGGFPCATQNLVMVDVREGECSPEFPIPS